jgi:hypothetical protein
MESKHRKCRESGIIYHYTSHISLTNVQELAYAPRITNLLFMARAWPHFLRACCWTLYSCSLSYIWNTCQWGHMQQDTGFAVTPDDWFMRVIPLFKCHNKHWHMHSETPGEWQLLSPHVLVAFIKTISMPYALWKHACIHLTPLET